LLRYLNNEVERTAKGLKDEVEAREKIERWIKESYRPTLAKIREQVRSRKVLFCVAQFFFFFFFFFFLSSKKLVDELAEVRQSIEAEQQFAQGLAQWIKTNLGTKCERVEALIAERIDAYAEIVLKDAKERDKVQWRTFDDRVAATRLADNEARAQADAALQRDLAALANAQRINFQRSSTTPCSPRRRQRSLPPPTSGRPSSPRCAPRSSSTASGSRSSPAPSRRSAPRCSASSQFWRAIASC
jgi:ATP-dependent Clp protease ATP-binding subunit ClpA